MIFSLKPMIFKWERWNEAKPDGTIVAKVRKGNCSHCRKQIPDNVMIMTQSYDNRFGGGLHKYCPECSEAGVKELKEVTKDIKFRAKIGWDNY